jgi:hypothetical protein
LNNGDEQPFTPDEHMDAIQEEEGVSMRGTDMRGGAPDSEVQYIGEFQTEYINSEIFGLFE